MRAGMQCPTELFQLARLLGGMPLLGCVPGSPSHRAGLRYGDVILEVDGRPTQDVDAYLRARELGGRRMQVVAMRAGRRMEVTLEMGEGGVTPPCEIEAELGASERRRGRC